MRVFRAGMRAAFLALLLVGSASVVAQEYHVHRYTEDDGLPSSTVRAIEQDSFGRMVFGSRSGISFYDGLEWETRGLPEGLDPSDTAFLRHDENGDLWTVSSRRSAIVHRFDGDRWHRYPRVMQEAPDSLVYAFGLLGSSRPVPVVSISTGSFRWNGDGWTPLIDRSGSAIPAAYVMHSDGGRVWLGTEDGLWRLESDGSTERVLDHLPQGRVFGVGEAICADGVEPCLWVAGKDWVGRVNGSEFEPVECQGTKLLSGFDLSLHLLDDQAGGLFVGSMAALRHLPRDRCGFSIGRVNGLVADGVLDLFRDSDDNVWVANPQGVSKLTGFRFATWREKHGLFEDEVTSTVERPDGSLVFGHRGGLTIVTDDRVEALSFGLEATLRPGARVVDMALAPDGSVWVAAYHEGLARLHPDNRLEWVRDARFKMPVSSVTVGHDGELWVLAASELFRRVAGRFDLKDDALLPGYGRRAFTLANGDIAIATSQQGIYVYGEEPYWILPAGRSMTDVYALLEQPDGTMLVGTSEGLGRVEEQRIVPASWFDPPVKRPVFFIAEDTEGAIWLGTDNGVLVWDGAAMRRFTVDDGIGGRETNRDAVLVDSRGHVWVGTAQGVTAYRREFERSAEHPPRVSLIGMQAGGRREDPSRPMDLQNDRNDLNFEFRAISMVDESRIEVRTWLEGSDLGWTEPGPLIGASQFVGLSPGRYRFHVQAALPNGVWSEPATSEWIRIRYPFFMRGWFIGLVALGLIGLAIAGQRFFAKHQYTRRLEAEVESRMHDLQRAETELARVQRLESLGLLAGGIAHDFNNLLTVILGNLSLIARRGQQRDTRAFESTTTAIQRAQDLTTQLLTFSRGGAPVREAMHVEKVVADSAAMALSGSTVRSELDLAADLWPAEIDAGQIGQVLNNLLINASQAMSEGGVVRIVARNVDMAPSPLEHGRYIRISVADQGPGIEAEHLPKVFEPYFSTKDGGSGLGLASAWSIARRHDGLLTAEAAPGRGAIFHLYLPASARPVVKPDAESPDAGSRTPYVEGLPRVLVMDDESTVREVTCAMLQHLGYACFAVADGEAAVAAYREALDQGRGFVAVILDLTIPGGMGGEEAIRRLQEIDPDVRAIVSSGYSNSPVMANHQDYGFSARVGKPFRVEQLGAELSRLADRRPVS